MRLTTAAKLADFPAAMTLNHYLISFNISPKEFALRLEDASEDSVRNWASGRRFPRPDQMKGIFIATDGMVTPNDFHGIGLTLIA